MAFLNKKHLLLASVLVEQTVDLRERDEGILLGSDEDARSGDILHQLA